MVRARAAVANLSSNNLQELLHASVLTTARLELELTTTTVVHVLPGTFMLVDAATHLRATEVIQRH
jgi:hypothetical protein